MNMLHVKYAVAIAKTQSLNKAAEMLFVGQPNLSRAIKELENDIGITIFERSAKGMTLTPDGSIFIKYAKSILKQIDDVENMFKDDFPKKQRFSISVPRASYITEAFARFSKTFTKEDEIEIFYKETNSMRTLKNVLEDDYKLGIVRFSENYDKFYKNALEQKNLSYEILTEFKYVLLMSKDSPLASKDNITYDDLKDYIEVAHADPYVPSLPFAEVKKEELPDNAKRRVFLFDRASQFELLSQNSECFMWVSPIPQDLMNRYDLVERTCLENKRKYKDVLIHKNDYTLTDTDKKFVEFLIDAKRCVIDRFHEGEG